MDAIDDVVAWIASVPQDAWPMWVRHPEHKGNFRPSVNSDLEWQGFGEKTAKLVEQVLAGFIGCYAANRAITVVLPGDYVPPHTDLQPPEWITRIHVPLMTNDKAEFLLDGDWVHMKVGQIYHVDTEKPHAIRNNGNVPRVHFMFDVMSRFAGRTRLIHDDKRQQNHSGA